MSAETLRRAAALMRERAEAATNYPWASTAPGEVWKHYDGQVNAVGFPDDFDPLICDVLDNDDAQHIASWHPAVALAVADWLDKTAAKYEAIRGGFSPSSRVGAEVAESNTLAFNEALGVARAYLGSDA